MTGAEETVHSRRRNSEERHTLPFLALLLTFSLGVVKMSGPRWMWDLIRFRGFVFVRAANALFVHSWFVTPGVFPLLAWLHVQFWGVFLAKDKWMIVIHYLSASHWTDRPWRQLQDQWCWLYQWPKKWRALNQLGWEVAPDHRHHHHHRRPLYFIGVEWVPKEKFLAKAGTFRFPRVWGCKSGRIFASSSFCQQRLAFEERTDGNRFFGLLSLHPIIGGLGWLFHCFCHGPKLGNELHFAFKRWGEFWVSWNSNKTESPLPGMAPPKGSQSEYQQSTTRKVSTLSTLITKYHLVRDQRARATFPKIWRHDVFFGIN